MSAAMVSIPLTELDLIRSELIEAKSQVSDLKTKIASVTVEVIETSYQNNYIRYGIRTEPRLVKTPVKVVSYVNLEQTMDMLRGEAFDQIQERFDGVVKENSRLQGYLADKKEDIAKLEQHVRDLENGQKKRDDEVELKKLREESFELNRSYLNEKNLREGLVKQYNQLADTLALLQEKKWYQFWK